ncbi:hypothetical protein MKK58_02575 [Methylobacterium sp. J-078]|uniref:hypothetical protein n=1 Tax=Methylobacterium sp. J-078 TaxID=2836657 RepID=UPI001FB8EB7C|nr:hypothetical protein [Methylobacterium sp. J-078]MCJ2043433.1 hypothetical protein [Methylobacterium sp. J-078]
MTVFRTPRGLVSAGLLALGLAACTSTETRPPPSAPVAVTPPPAAPTFTGPVVTGEGTCTGPAPTMAAAIEIGIGECDLVRLKGKPPTDVLVGEGRSGREVQVLYNEPGAKELYFFVNNRLDRIVK